MPWVNLFQDEPAWAGGDTPDESWTDDGQDYEADTTEASDTEVDDYASDEGDSDEE